MEVNCLTENEYFDRADIVFIGEVLERAVVEDEDNGICWTQAQGTACGAKVATFKIEEILKGDESNVTTVFAEDGCYCVGPYLEAGRRYKVYGIADGDRAAYSSMNGCATRALSETEI